MNREVVVMDALPGMKPGDVFYMNSGSPVMLHVRGLFDDEDEVERRALLSRLGNKRATQEGCA